MEHIYQWRYKKSAMKRKRFGRFFLSIRFIEDMPDKVVAMFFRLEIIVVRAEMLYDRNGIEYIGISPHFEEIDASFVTPEYEILGMISNEENYTVRKVKYA
jgi:hypothetical protein